MTNTVQIDGISYRLPDFFIAGVAKAGTTTLWSYLRQHPGIFMPQRKEPSYFSFLRNFPSFEIYLNLFTPATATQLLGEASTAYLTCPESPVLIQKIAPQAKFIVILRHPVDRAYSLYHFMCRIGREHAGSFEKALQLEEVKRFGNLNFRLNNPHYYYNYLYFRSGLYSEQVKRYQLLFPREQLLFLKFDELQADPQAFVQKAFAFLDIDPLTVTKIRPENIGTMPYSQPLQVFIRQPFHHLLKLLPTSAKTNEKIVRKLLHYNIKAAKLPPIRPETYGKLIAQYWDDIQTTADLTGLDLQDWFK